MKDFRGVAMVSRGGEMSFGCWSIDLIVLLSHPIHNYSREKSNSKPSFSKLIFVLFRIKLVVRIYTMAGSLNRVLFECILSQGFCSSVNSFYRRAVAYKMLTNINK